MRGRRSKSLTGRRDGSDRSRGEKEEDAVRGAVDMSAGDCRT